MVSVAGVVDVGTEVSGVVLAGVLQLVKGRACGPPALKTNFLSRTISPEIVETFTTEETQWLIRVTI